MAAAIQMMMFTRIRAEIVLTTLKGRMRILVGTRLVAHLRHSVRDRAIILLGSPRGKQDIWLKDIKNNLTHRGEGAFPPSRLR